MQKSYYFPHDYSAHTDVKILFLRQQLGMEGYGIYWFIIEQLAIAGGVMPMKIIPVLAMQMQVTETKVHGVITKFDLFVVNDENFFSVRIKKFLKTQKNISTKRREAVSSRWKSIDNKHTNVLQENNNSTINKINKSKVNKINKINIPEEFREVWDRWIIYKKEEHGERYKTSTTEQQAVDNLINLSCNSPDKADQIINQSIGNRWKGLFKLNANDTSSRGTKKTTMELYQQHIKEYGEIYGNADEFGNEAT